MFKPPQFNRPQFPKVPVFAIARRPDSAGFYYIEVMIATLLIAVSLIPAMEALYPGTLGATIHQSANTDRYLLTEKMEQVLAESFSALAAEADLVANPSLATAYSDNFTSSDGRLIMRQVYLARYDGDNADSDDDPFTGVDNDLIWVRVELAGTNRSLTSLTQRNF